MFVKGKNMSFSFHTFYFCAGISCNGKKSALMNHLRLRVKIGLGREENESRK